MTSYTHRLRTCHTVRPTLRHTPFWAPLLYYDVLMTILSPQGKGANGSSSDAIVLLLATRHERVEAILWLSLHPFDSDYQRSRDSFTWNQLYSNTAMTQSVLVML